LWLPMRARAVDEEHRAATPLELLFDLTFVVAVSQAAAALAHGVAEGHIATAVPGYLLVFFAIWWAWMNFTWFASAYDTDDVPYRLLTLMQMAGVLVLAAGVGPASDAYDYRAVTIAYVVMRLALVLQWLRAARSDPEHAVTARRYAAGITMVQVLWMLRLLLPREPGTLVVGSFLVLAVAELAVPYWAERESMTTWHPHHIAERYGLFTIIVLGECVLGATTAVEAAVGGSGWSPALLGTGAVGLVLVFALWWLYFLRESATGLERRRDLSFRWGYGHYVVFASIAALGAGLEVAVEAVAGHDVPVGDVAVVAAVAIPVAVFLLVAWWLHATIAVTPGRDNALVVAATIATLATIALPSTGFPLPWTLAVLCVPAVALVAFKIPREVP
jgi:low temperature requirement protein LtrA